ncbi:MAG TPA: glutamate--tRNA ligase, partial [Vicinamibacterales bacterium]|nr:glutamate--tRNA ligase [Vicinamibacterales bacterium]
MDNDKPRLRFAPSPTGYLHVGGARTALFNWLYARRHGGTFVLRIEDTDVERSSADMVSGILDGLRWLGLDWDEGPEAGGDYGPYFQSRRLDRHRALAGALVASGHAYRCYCSSDRLKEERQRAEAAGGGWLYDRRCLSLTPEQISDYQAAGAAPAIRFRVPEGGTRFTDLVHGPIAFDRAHIEDFVILRSDGQPTYHLSVVADDVEMRITHVVRGDDHISNTPKHVMLFEALGSPVPQFAHVPLILGPDKKRLSKRHGATSVTEYERRGYLAEAMVNFLALLGWSPGTNQEIFTRDELIAQFALEGISGGNAVFNHEKLDWMNAQHVGRLANESIVAMIRGDLESRRLWSAAYEDSRRVWLHRVVDLVKPRVKKVSDFIPQLGPFLRERVDYDPAAVEKHLGTAGLADHIAALGDAFQTLDSFDVATTETALRQVAEDRGVKAGALIHATRVALTGKAVSPGLFEVAALV